MAPRGAPQAGHLLDHELGVGIDPDRDGRRRLQVLQQEQAGLRRQILRLIARAITRRKMLGKDHLLFLERVQTEVHGAGIFAQAVDEQVDGGAGVKGDLIIVPDLLGPGLEFVGKFRSHG